MIMALVLAAFGQIPSIEEVKKETQEYCVFKWSNKNIEDFLKGYKEEAKLKLSKEIHLKLIIIGLMAFEKTSAKEIGLMKAEKYLKKNVNSDDDAEKLGSKEFIRKYKKEIEKTMEENEMLKKVY